MAKAILFDMDGVIFDTEKLWKIAYKRSNKKFNLKLGEKFRRNLCGKKEIIIRQEMQELFPDVDINAYRDYTLQEYRQLVNTKVCIKKGFYKLITYLKNNNYTTALVTSSKQAHVDLLFKKAGYDISQMFDYVLSGDQAKIGKPDPYVYLETCKQLGKKTQDCIVLEDSPNGIKSSSSAGCYTIMVVDLIRPDAELKPLCNKVFYSLNQVLKYIQKQENI